MSESYPVAPPPSTPVSDRVAWRARDLFFALAGGLALSVVLILPVAMVAFRDAQTMRSLEVVGGIGILIYVAVALASWYFALQRRGVGWREAGFRRVAPATLLKMVPVTIGMMLLTGIFVSLTAEAVGDVPTAQDQIVGDANAITMSEFLWLFALAAVAAPVVEEFFFRGLLYPLLRGRLKVVAAVVASALIFASLHFLLPLIPALLMMGVVLALVRERYDSIVPAIAVHALNNGTVMIGLYAAIGR